MRWMRITPIVGVRAIMIETISSRCIPDAVGLHGGGLLKGRGRR
jgi:hypothetical protein